MNKPDTELAHRHSSLQQDPLFDLWPRRGSLRIELLSAAKSASNLLLILIILTTISIVRESSFASTALRQVAGGTELTDTDPMQVSTLVKSARIEAGQNTTLEIKTQLPKNFHAYSDQLRVEVLSPEGFQVSQAKIQPEIEFYDKFSRRTRKGFESETTLRYQIEAPLKIQESSSELKIAFTYQACSDSFCLFPVTKELKASVDIIGNGSQLADLKLAEILSEKGFESALKENIFLAFILVFIAGILTSFTPCIFPMIPITLSIIGQSSIHRTRRESFMLSLAYVHGIALTYSLLGVFAALSGGLFGQWSGNKFVLGALSALFLVMSLGMYGFFEIQLPLFLQNKLQRKTHKSEGSSLISAFVTGMFSGLVASPCVGPVLVSILAFVASTKNVVLGFFLLFTYAMGLGLIFMILGLFSQVTRLLPKSGPWMNSIKFILGSLMLGAFYYYLRLLVPVEAWRSALGLGGFLMAYFLGAFQWHPTHSKFVRITRGFARAILFAMVIYFGYLVLISTSQPTPDSMTIEDQRWEPYTQGKIDQARALQTPVMIDFYADWCLACHELDEKTFSTREFKTASSKFKLLRFNATNDSKELDELKKIYRIRGLPTVVFINQRGEILHDLTLTNFETMDRLKKRMDAIQ